MSYYNKSFQSRLTPAELLAVQTRALQSSVPKEVKFNGNPHVLTKQERKAAGRVIWYILQRGWGLSTAVSKASGSFNCSAIMLSRAVRPIFPEKYFGVLEQCKNYVMLDKTAMAEEEEGE